MDNKEATYIKAIISVVVLALVWLFLRNRGGPSIVQEAGMSPFAVPYFYTNPGIADNTDFLNGGPTFNSVNTVNVRTGAINGLSNNYMPMFGLVGMTAVAG